MIHINKDWLPCDDVILSPTHIGHSRLLGYFVNITLSFCESGFEPVRFTFQKSVFTKLDIVMCKFNTLYSSFLQSIYFRDGIGNPKVYTCNISLNEDSEYYIFKGNSFFSVIPSDNLHPNDAMYLIGYDIIYMDTKVVECVTESFHKRVFQLEGNRLIL